MDSDLLEMCRRLALELQRFYPLIRVTSLVAGLSLVGFGLHGLYRAGDEHRPVLPQLASVLVGVLLASFTAVLDALSQSLFRQSAPTDFASVQVGQAAGLEPMVQLALVIVMVVGAYQVVKGFILLKEAAHGGRLFWPAVTHILGGVLCLNMRTFLLALGETMGGTLQETLQLLLGA